MLPGPCPPIAFVSKATLEEVRSETAHVRRVHVEKSAYTTDINRTQNDNGTKIKRQMSTE